MPLQISDSINALTDRIETVLKAELPAMLSAREAADYPLPAPEAYIVGDESFDAISEHLGNPDVYCSIIYTPSDLSDRGTGDGTVESYNQITQVGVSLVLRRSIGVELPTRNGRKLLMAEWERIRAEMYRGVLQDLLPKHLEDGTNVKQVALNTSAVSPPITQDSGIYREATVMIDVLQEVTVNVA